MAPVVRNSRHAAVILSALVLASCSPADTGAAQGGAPPKPDGPVASQPAKPADEKKKEPERVPVTVGGTTFKLEPALDDATRIKGLGGRAAIEETGGMVFVFTNIVPRDFVMRDCPAAIDIL